MAEGSEALKARLASISEKYSAAIAAMDHRELVDELEKRALMASYGALDPTTAMLLKMAKAEILARIKGDSPVPAKSEKPLDAAPKAKPTLFD